MMNKKQIIKEIHKELLGKISYLDIFSVVNILVDELKQELISGKSILIPNFSKLEIKSFEPKRIKNVRNNRLQKTKPYRSLRMKLSKNIIKYLQ